MVFFPFTEISLFMSCSKKSYPDVLKPDECKNISTWQEKKRTNIIHLFSESVPAAEKDTRDRLPIQHRPAETTGTSNTGRQHTSFSRYGSYIMFNVDGGEGGGVEKLDVKTTWKKIFT